MTAVSFDTLAMARKLRDTAEMPQVQADGVVAAMAEAMSGAQLATKNDIRELELKMDARFADITGQFKEIAGQFKEVDVRFETVLERIDRRAAETDARLVRYVVGVGVATILTVLGAAAAIIRYLPVLLPHN